MRSVLSLITRLFCSLALVMAMVPAWATEAVCVMPHREPVPMATCGMPCCTHGTKATSEAPKTEPVRKPDCCDGPTHPTLGGTAHPLSAIQAACRCETRVTGSVAPSSLAPSALPIPSGAPLAILATVREISPALRAIVIEPGLAGADPGPPSDPTLCEPPGRAPPHR